MARWRKITRMGKGGVFASATHLPTGVVVIPIPTATGISPSPEIVDAPDMSVVSYIPMD